MYVCFLDFAGFDKYQVLKLRQDVIAPILLTGTPRVPNFFFFKFIEVPIL